MGLSSPDSGATKDVGNGPSSMNHNDFGGTLMNMIKARYPIAGAIGNAVGIGSPATAPAASAGGVPDQPALPSFAPTQQADIDPAMTQAGQVGSQHSQLMKDIIKAISGGG